MLRGLVGTQAFQRVWTAKNPPSSAASYGLALRSQVIGDTIHDLLADLATGPAAAVRYSRRTLTQVKNHKPIIFK